MTYPPFPPYKCPSMTVTVSTEPDVLLASSCVPLYIRMLGQPRRFCVGSVISASQPLRSRPHSDSIKQFSVQCGLHIDKETAVKSVAQHLHRHCEEWDRVAVDRPVRSPRRFSASVPSCNAHDSNSMASKRKAEDSGIVEPKRQQLEHELSRSCPYLDTIDRHVLDFDFQKVSCTRHPLRSMQ